MGIHDFWLFVVAGVLLNITPGPDVALVVSRSVNHGARMGAAAALGIGAGALVHITAAAIGLSALLVSSARAFSALKWAGALYLVYLGLSLIAASFKSSTEPVARSRAASTASLRNSFVQGFLTNVLNPKVALFFLAFMPQFIDPGAPSKSAAFAVLGLTFNCTGTAWNLLVAVFADRAARSSTFGAAKRWLDRAVGGVFVALGARLAVSER
jgi:RhtB (resistance to homoserine/threonine) family protein